MGEIVSAALLLGVEVFKLLNTDASRKYLDKVTDLRLKIIEEKAKHQDRDDVLLGDMYKQLAVLLEAAHAELQTYANKPKAS